MATSTVDEFDGRVIEHDDVNEAPDDPLEITSHAHAKPVERIFENRSEQDRNFHIAR